MAEIRRSHTIKDWRNEKPKKGRKCWKLNKNAKEEHIRQVKKREDYERFLEAMTDG